MDRDINKIIEEVLASLSLENIIVCDKKIEEIKMKHKKLNRKDKSRIRRR